MRAIWKGAVSFGLVSIPVKVVPARVDRDIHFTYLHKTCGTRLQMRRYCPTDEMLVEEPDQIRAYEYARDRYVPVSREETDAIRVESSRTVRILDFVEASEIDPIYYERPYYLTPDRGGERTYVLLRRAMEATGRAGIGKVALRESREHLAVVRVLDRALVMETIAYPDEVRSEEVLEQLPGEIEVDPRELSMAVELVRALAAPFDPGRYKDEYRETVQALIEAKRHGQTVQPMLPPERPEVGDLMEALRRSVEQMREARGEERGDGQTAAHDTLEVVEEALPGGGTGDQTDREARAARSGEAVE